MRCNKCLVDRTIDSFSFKDKKKNTRQKICKSCHSRYRRQHYLQNKSKYIEKALRWNKRQGEVLAEYFYNTLSTSQCIDCKEHDILVLEFDHISNKKLGLSEMYKIGIL